MTPKCSDQKCIYAFIFPQNVHLESHIIIDNEENNIYIYIYIFVPAKECQNTTNKISPKIKPKPQ